MMRKLLKGNYEPTTNPEVKQQPKEESEFEKASIENLGGSIAFVRGGKLYEENT